MYRKDWVKLNFNLGDAASQERRFNPLDLPTALRRQEMKDKKFVTQIRMERTTIRSIKPPQHHR